MTNKKTLTIVVLIAIALVFIMLFGKLPSATTPETSIDQTPSNTADTSTPALPDSPSTLSQ